MNVLLIGAGAVGQAYGYHFQRGGAAVTFFVRARYADEARRGFGLYPLNRRNPREAPVHFEGFEVAPSRDERRVLLERVAVRLRIRVDRGTTREAGRIPAAMGGSCPAWADDPAAVVRGQPRSMVLARDSNCYPEVPATRLRAALDERAQRGLDDLVEEDGQ